MSWANLHSLAFGFGSAVDSREYHTRFHSYRVSEIATAMTRVLGVEKEERDEIHLGAHLHDIGKVHIADEVLQKKGPFTENDCWEMQQHPEAGYRIVKRSGMPRVVLNIVRHHHERYDGMGYPDGLEGKSIPREARILAIADTLDAMASGRAHCDAVPLDLAFTEIEMCSGTQLDPHMIEVILAVNRGFLERLFKRGQDSHVLADEAVFYA